MLLLILTSFAVVLVSSLVALFESSIIYTDEIKLQYFLEKSKAKERKAKTLKSIIENKEKYISSLAIFSTTANVLGSTIIGAMASRQFHGISLMIFMGIILYCMLVFSKILPKVIAISKYDSILLKSYIIIRIAKILASPLLIFTLFWFKIFKSETKRMSIGELKIIIDHFSKQDSFSKKEGLMLDNILSLKNKTILDIIDKKNEEVITLDCKRKIKKYRQQIVESSVKIYLVEDDGIVEGIAFYRDIADKLLEHTDQNSETFHPRVKDCIKSAIRVKESDNLLTAISKFKETKERYAIVENDDEKPIGIVTAKQVYTYSLNY